MEEPTTSVPEKEDNVETTDPVIRPSTSGVEPTTTVVPGPPCDWIEKYDQKLLTDDDFRSYWRHWVPYVLAPKTNSYNIDDPTERMTKVDRILLKPLRDFICKDTVSSLDTLTKPSSVCGHSFYPGEPIYFCRDCGTDSTCVLCIECFKHSAHKTHKYRMGTSMGRGFCDCGDSEAWKTNSKCDIHLVRADSSAESSLPSDIVPRAEIAIDVVLKYSSSLLTLEYTPFPPYDLKGPDDGLGIFGYIDKTDMYCLLLYSDEKLLAFDLVVRLVAKVFSFPHRHTIDLVSCIGAKGRAVLLCSTFKNCQDMKLKFERSTEGYTTNSSPLRLQVVHVNLIAHQEFALCLLEWLCDVIALNEGFRSILRNIAFKTTDGKPCIVGGILAKDSSLWKISQQRWYRLFTSGFLIDLDSKKEFAQTFIKHYPVIMSRYIQNEHKLTLSVANLTLQIFTAPRLARTLIAECNAPHVLINTFFSEVSSKYTNSMGKIELERRPPAVFKRAMTILNDIRLILGTVPASWTDAMRSSFLKGITVLVRLLSSMHEMDTVVRQVSNHIEFDPEWELSFSFIFKLLPVITRITRWCVSDKTILIETYKQVLVSLDTDSNIKSYKEVTRSVAGHTAACIKYDVSLQPTSIHLPISCFYAALYLSLRDYNLNFYSEEVAVEYCGLTPVMIMEPVLRAQALIAQANAGMWRRNGYTLTTVIHFYHSPDFRGEMLDKDIVLLQICGSLTDSNAFLIHFLNKYNLLEWADEVWETKFFPNSDNDEMKQAQLVAENFLTKILHVFCERYNPSVSEVTVKDCLKNVIIQNLCVKSFTHSQLNKIIPGDIPGEIDDVVGEVATFHPPTKSDAGGFYQLKPEMRSLYNPLWYHYNKEDLSRSEEEQRQKHKEATGLDCCPPPILPKLNDSFKPLINIIQCDVMLYIMQLVLKRAIYLNSNSISETHVQRVLYLIGHGLQEEESGFYESLKFTSAAEKWEIEKLLHNLFTANRIDLHKDLLKWTIGKYQEVKSRYSPVSHEPWQADLAIKEKEDKAKLAAAERREKIMAQMAVMQKNFMKDNAQLFAAPEGEKDAAPEGEKDSDEAEKTDVPQVPSKVVFGYGRLKKEDVVEKHTCILCQEVSAVSRDGPPMVLVGFVQRSTVLARDRSKKSVDRNLTPAEQLVLTLNLAPSPHLSSCGHIMHNSCWQKYFDDLCSKEARIIYRPRNSGSYDVTKNEFLCPLCERVSNTVFPIIPPLAMIAPEPNHSLDKFPFQNWFISALGATLEHKDKPKALNLLSRAPPQVPKAKPKPVSKSWNKGPSLLLTGQRRQESLQHFLSSIYMDTTVSGTSSQGNLLSNINNDMMFRLKIQTNGDKQRSRTVATGGDFLSEEMLVVLSKLSYRIHSTVFTSSPPIHPEDPVIPFNVWKSCAYTIMSVEQLLRYDRNSLFSQISSRLDTFLHVLVRLSATMAAAWKDIKVIKSLGLDLLTMVMGSTETSILDFDCFGMLVPLVSSLPLLYFEDHIRIPVGSTLELYAFTLLLYCHIAQVIINTDLAQFESTEESPTESEETACLVPLVKHLKTFTKLRTDDLWSLIKEQVRPFLRCCAIFYHYLTNQSDKTEADHLYVLKGDTFENLCSYMGVTSSCKELMSAECLDILFDSWGNHEKIIALRKSSGPIKSFLTINSLIPLVEDYSDLINSLPSLKCSEVCKDCNKPPCMCLICGEILCSQAYCCQGMLGELRVGPCMVHTDNCGHGSGMYFRITDCSVVLLTTPVRGCMRGPPYVDKYGETDIGLRRGNPLYLCKDRYKKLERMWLSHSIYEEVGRIREERTPIVHTPWQFM